MCIKFTRTNTKRYNIPYKIITNVNKLYWIIDIIHSYFFIYLRLYNFGTTLLKLIYNTSLFPYINIQIQCYIL